MKRGLLVAVIHVLIVCSIAGKLSFDRMTRPRVWAKAASYDPNLPIRGRYVSLQVTLPAGTPNFIGPQQVVFFIPEHAADPSRRAVDEELWVEVTIPKKGPPRPIQLGVKKNGVLTPLKLD